MRYLAMLAIVCFFGTPYSRAQTTITGSVREESTGSAIPFAMVRFSQQNVTTTDMDGNFLLKVAPGKYDVVVGAFEFDTLRQSILVNEVDYSGLIFELKGNVILQEVVVIGNKAGERTPIALTRISLEKIQEELVSRDLPMLLNATPGVFATQSGGGDGDARITVRGFDQRNVGVMIDGVPVNDMENGQVYWSNWFGLDAITNEIQVQRGLGATKIAMPSVGGTLNILTSGIGDRKGISFKQEFATGNFIRTSLSYNSGLTKKGYGLTFSTSYKQGDGWVSGTNTQGLFYYLKLQKKFKSHLLTLSGFGAPQKHGQRTYNQPVQYWDASYAEGLGLTVDTTQPHDRGIRFSQHWGYITEDGQSVVKNEQLNYYHKPQFTIKDFWTVNSRLFISNLAYASIGNGGGTRMNNSSGIIYTDEGLIDWDRIIQGNKVNQLFGGPNTDPLYDPELLKSSQILVSSVNNHFWVGYLGQFKYIATESLTISGGLDYRYYKGQHYQEVYDLLGGDYFVSTDDQNDPNPMKKKGDKIALNTFNNNRDGLVQWGGTFGQAEYATKKWTAFFNVSGVLSGYKGVDYFQKKTLEVGDTTLRIGHSDTITYNGQTYTASSPGLEYFQTDWKKIPGGTIKMGASYAVNEFLKVFVNTGYLSRTPQFSNVIDNNTNTFFANIKNEKIMAVEAGSSYTRKRFGVHFNVFYTNWLNKPYPFGVPIPDPNDPLTTIRVNINGMDALHKGFEVDAAYKLNKHLSGELMYSLGDYVWNSTGELSVPEFNYKETFDAKGVHVGDAAQHMLNLGLRYDVVKGMYVKVQFQWFGKYYSNFSPFTLKGADAGRESYRIPDYYLVNAFAGYSKKFGKISGYLNAGITNVLNRIYMADATNNFYAPADFGAGSASVMFGQGFRFNLSLGINF